MSLKSKGKRKEINKKSPASFANLRVALKPSSSRSRSCSQMFWLTQISGVSRTVRAFETARFLQRTANGRSFSGTFVTWCGCNHKKKSCMQEHQQRSSDRVMIQSLQRIGTYPKSSRLKFAVVTPKGTKGEKCHSSSKVQAMNVQ